MAATEVGRQNLPASNQIPELRARHLWAPLRAGDPSTATSWELEVRFASWAFNPPLKNGMAGSLVHAHNLRLLLALTARDSATMQQQCTIAVDLGGTGPPVTRTPGPGCGLTDLASTKRMTADGAPGTHYGTMPPVISASQRPGLEGTSTATTFSELSWNYRWHWWDGVFCNVWHTQPLPHCWSWGRSGFDQRIPLCN